MCESSCQQHHIMFCPYVNSSEGIYFLLQTATWGITTIVSTIRLIITFVSMRIGSAITKDNNLLLCHKSSGLESVKENKLHCSFSRVSHD